MLDDVPKRDDREMTVGIFRLFQAPVKDCQVALLTRIFARKLRKIQAVRLPPALSRELQESPIGTADVEKAALWNHALQPIEHSTIDEEWLNVAGCAHFQGVEEGRVKIFTVIVEASCVLAGD